MDASLLDMAFADIERACRPGEVDGAKLAGFLLAFCFLEAVSGFYAGRRKRDSGLAANFRAFVDAYMPGYNARHLYSDLRSGLVHSYAIGKTYAFTNLESDGKHLSVASTFLGRRTLLDLEHFVSDVKDAYLAFRADILSDPGRFASAQTRYDSIGLIRAG